MAPFFRYLAPAGSPVTTVDLLRWFGTVFSNQAASVVLEQAIRDRFDVRHVTLTSTGRAGLTLLLRAMRRLADRTRDQVVVPSYTCYSVPASVVKAGLRPRIVDISPRTLDYAPEALERTDYSRVLAIVATNLYGLPNNLPALERVAHKNGVFLIDDAAQALGATVGGRWSGTWGDAGLFSFDKGKNVSAIDGGILVTHSDALAAALKEETARLETPGPGTSAVHVLKALAYFALLRPSLYGIPARIPQLGLGRTVYTTDYALSQPDRVLVALGLTMLPRLDEFTRARRANAAALLAQLRGIELDTVQPLAGSEPAYLRLPLLVINEQQRSATIEALNSAGIGATRSYPASIADVAELRAELADPKPVATGGREIARRIVTLPTHPLVGAADISRMRMILEGRGISASHARATA
jgi:dTDP-4-amino-4,6-dideoxygalactose transaminase